MIKNPVPWPNGARCAVAITFDMDADSLIHLEHANGINRISGLSMLKYGPEEAVPRILDTYKKFNIKQTFFIPAWCIEQYPATIEAILEDGHEIAHHGFIHENPHDGGRVEEKYWLERAVDVIQKFTGQKPRGSRAPLYNYSKDSTDLLLDQGILYDASLMGSDSPYVLKSNERELIELPSHWGMDDWPQYVHTMDLDFMMPVKSPSGGMEVFREEFDAMWEFGGLWVGVWHPFATGRLARWLQVVKLIEYMQDKGDVWFARMEDIAQHVRDCIDDGSYTPRVDDLPYYDTAVTPLERP